MIVLNFKRWDGGAHNWSRWGIKFKRIYVKGRWTPLVIWCPHRLKAADAEPEEPDHG